MSFENLKKQSKLGSLTSKLVKEVEKMSTGESGADDRFWKPEVDKVGNGFATIRFLPAPEGEDLPWSKVWSHAFQGPGGWYIENSLTTLNQKDPVSEYNRGLWNSGNEKDKETVRKQKRKLSYYANIYVVKDPTNPQNEGKVFLYKFGKKIFDKIMAAMQPEFEDEEAINPFDFWQGANFKLKIRKVDGYWNYDKSEFESPGPLLSDDDALEAIWKKQNSLTDFLAAANFKSHEELEKRLNQVLGAKQPQRRVDPEVQDEEYTPEVEEKSYTPSFNAPQPVDEDEDDALSYFQRLAEE
jgi:hypothetical protein